MGANHFARRRPPRTASCCWPELAYTILQTAIIRPAARYSALAGPAHDWKGKLSPLIYITGIGLSFVDRWLGVAMYVLAALIWLIPDRRVSRALQATDGSTQDKMSW